MRATTRRSEAPPRTRAVHLVRKGRRSLPGRPLPRQHEHMATEKGNSQPGQAGEPQPGGAPRDARSVRQPQRGGRRLALADFERAITAMETTGRIEMDIAATLRAMAAKDGSDAAARRRRLAEVAMRAAQVAVDHSERMRQQARECPEHADVVALWQSLEDACWLLVDLARTEELLAGILRTMAGPAGCESAPSSTIMTGTSPARARADKRGQATSPGDDAAHAVVAPGGRDLSADASTRLDAIFARWREKYPGVQTGWEVMHAHPARVLAGGRPDRARSAQCQVGRRLGHAHGAGPRARSGRCHPR